MTRTNGHNVKELNRNFPPVMLRQLAGRDDLPFCELAEIQLALDVAEQLEADVLSVFGDIATGGEPFDQWHIAVMLRRHYTARLRNLALRLQRGDPDTVANIIGDA